MDFLEVTRVFLFLVEWIWTACAAFMFPDQLMEKLPSVKAEGNVCFFDRQLDLSRCNFGLAWGLIAFLIISVTIIWYCLGFCTSFQLPANVEVIIFAWLTLWWFVGAVTLSAVRSGNTIGAARSVLAFAWMLVFLSAASAFIASRPPKEMDAYPVEISDDRSYQADSMSNI